MHLFTEKIWDKRKTIPKPSKEQKFLMPGRWGMVIKKKQTWSRATYSPFKTNAWNLKITSFEKGTSSEPNLHDFGFKMSAFEGVSSPHMLDQRRKTTKHRIRVQVPVGHLRFDVLLSWERLHIPSQGYSKESMIFRTSSLMEYVIVPRGYV